MNASNPDLVGWTALVGGIVGVIGFIALALLFVVGEPFGTINDILSIPVAFLMMPLVVALYRLQAADHAALSLIALVAGVAGFFAVAIGSALLVLNRISFEQSLLPGIGGFGLIGLWVLISCVLALRNQTLPKGTAWAGLLLAVAPSLILLATLRVSSVVTVLNSFADPSSLNGQASPLVYVFVILGMISYAGLPFWFIQMGRLALLGRMAVAAVAVQ